MSNIERFENVKQIVKMVEPDFNQLARIHGAVNYEREASFALQVLSENNYLATTAMGNQDSLKRAIINVAAIGLSLDPVKKLAYLVPRDKKVCLDISYQGYIQLATDEGAVSWVRAEIVYDNDTYKYLGVNREPLHEFDPFSDRGQPKGAYCLAKTPSGDLMLEQMSAQEIMAIRDRSVSYKGFKANGTSTPWETDRDQMIKKTIIKRAYKSWPKGAARDRLEKAIDVTNDLDLNNPQIQAPPVDSKRLQSLTDIREALAVLGRTEARYVEHLGRVCQREIKKLEDLTEQEVSRELTQLKQWVDAEKAKKAKDVKNENAV